MESLNSVFDTLTEFINNRKVNRESKLIELNTNVSDLRKLKNMFDSVSNNLEKIIDENETTVLSSFKELGYTPTSKRDPKNPWNNILPFEKSDKIIQVSPLHTDTIINGTSIELKSYGDNKLELNIPVNINGKDNVFRIVGNMFDKTYNKINHRDANKPKHEKTIIRITDRDHDYAANMDHIKSYNKSRKKDEYMNMSPEYVWGSNNIGSSKPDRFFMNISGSDELDNNIKTLISDLKDPYNNAIAKHRILMLNQYIVHLLCTSRQIFIRLHSEGVYPDLYY